MKDNDRTDAADNELEDATEENALNDVPRLHGRGCRGGSIEVQPAHRNLPPDSAAMPMSRKKVSAGGEEAQWVFGYTTVEGNGSPTGIPFDSEREDGVLRGYSTVHSRQSLAGYATPRARTSSPPVDGSLIAPVSRDCDDHVIRICENPYERCSQETPREVVFQVEDLVVLRAVAPVHLLSGRLPDILSRLENHLKICFPISGLLLFLPSQRARPIRPRSGRTAPRSVVDRIGAYLSTLGRAWGELGRDFGPDGPKQAPASGFPTLTSESGDRTWRHCLLLPLAPRSVSQGVLAMFSASSVVIGEDRIPFFELLAQQVAACVWNARLRAKARGNRRRLTALSQRLFEIQEAERRHLARELHDEIGQSLTVLNLNVAAFGTTMSADEYVTRRKECLDIIDSTIRQIRELSLDLRPAMLDELGLCATLRWYVSRQANRLGLAARVTLHEGELRDVSKEAETAIFRVVQEALTNVARHARAGRVRLSVRAHGPTLSICIRDDGVGLALGSETGTSAKGSGLGLLGMRERAALVGGRLDIRSVRGQGTLVRLSVPKRLPPGQA